MAFRRRIGAVAGLAGLVSCTSEPASPASTPWPDSPPASTGDAGINSPPACDPIAGVEEPIALGVVAFAGQAPDGTVVVVDAVKIPPPPGDYYRNPRSRNRIFVSEGNVLRRRDLRSMDSQLGQGDQTLNTRIELDDGGALIYWSSGTTGRFFPGDEECERRKPASCTTVDLTQIPTEQLARFSLQNLVGGRALHAQELANGMRLFLFAPHVDALWEPSRWRVFYGPPTQVQERKVLAGFLDLITFDVDGAAVTQRLPLNSQREALAAKTSAEVFAGVTVTSCL